jgi:hypothetical protein
LRLALREVVDEFLVWNLFESTGLSSGRLLQALVTRLVVINAHDLTLQNVLCKLLALDGSLVHLLLITYRFCFTRLD